MDNLAINSLNSLNSLNSSNNLDNFVKIQFTSDNHLEFYKDKKIDILDFITPCAPYLAILGDLGYPTLDNFKDFLSQTSKIYDKVFYLKGNHEFYQCNIQPIMTCDEINDKIQEICKSFDNVYYMDNTEHLLTDNIIILGSTLWSNIPQHQQSKIKQVINDYKYIFIKEKHYKTNISPKYTSDLHLYNVKWLENMLEKYKNKKVIILSHHLPTFELIAPEYKDSNSNCAFASNLDYLMKQNSNIKFWLCGHTHSNVETKINECECITNPFGYPNENNKYDKEKFILLKNNSFY